MMTETAAATAEEKGGGRTPRAKLYILDRTKGTSKQHPLPNFESNKSNTNIDDYSTKTKKPPCFICYVPPPVYYCAPILEQNIVCNTIGTIGCFGLDSFTKRRTILMFGLIANILSLFLGILACLAISLQFNILQAFSYSAGTVTIPSESNVNSIIDQIGSSLGEDVPSTDNAIHLVSIWIGLRGVALTTFTNITQIANNVPGNYVIGFDEFCGYINNGLENYMDPEDCHECADVSNGLVFSVIFTVLTTIPSITTDILRMYPTYDLNCQKFFGSVISIISFVSSMYTWMGYSKQCFVTFNQDNAQFVPYFIRNGTVASDEGSESGNAIDSLIDGDATVNVFFDWQAGAGLICLMVATILKFIDIVTSCLIPTPKIARNKELQEDYEMMYGSKDEEKDDENAQVDEIEEKREDKQEGAT